LLQWVAQLGFINLGRDVTVSFAPVGLNFEPHRTSLDCSIAEITVVLLLLVAQIHSAPCGIVPCTGRESMYYDWRRAGGELMWRREKIEQAEIETPTDTGENTLRALR